jgi:signal transduction histidine kinase
MQPPAVAKGVLKMFEGELLSCGIEHEFALEQSFQQYNIDWILADPSRLTQILINLMTNAIKFTRTEPMRHIRMSVGGSEHKPPYSETKNLEWFPSRGVRLKRDLTVDEEWGTGKDVYVYFAVQDSGSGLGDEEKRRLFHRFAVRLRLVVPVCLDKGRGLMLQSASEPTDPR